MKHTPGPWQSYNGEVTTRKTLGRSFRRIAVVQDYGLGSLPEVDEANAKLIAAAPDLLEALESACGCIEASLDEVPSETREAMESDLARYRAVIAKAKGEA